MIKLTKLNKTQFVLNCELIETIEATPDSVITLTNGKKYVVLEDIDEIIEKIVAFKKHLIHNDFSCTKE